MGLGNAAANAAVSAAAKKAEMLGRMIGRTEEQKKVIKYFYGAGGCFSFNLTDEQYEGMVSSRMQGIAFKQKALEKLGLDESQVQEIAPIHFEQYDFGDGALCKGSKNFTKWLSSVFQITWLFFGDEQMYVYQYTFHMDTDEESEETREFFYKDVTMFKFEDSIQEEWVPGGKNCIGQTQLVRKGINRNKFAIIVPGDTFYCSVHKNEYTERSMRGMNAKLREKKM